MKVWLSVRIDDDQLDALAEYILAGTLGVTEDDLAIDDPEDSTTDVV